MRAGASKMPLGGPGLKVVRFKAQSLQWIAVVPFWTKQMAHRHVLVHGALLRAQAQSLPFLKRREARPSAQGLNR